MQKVLWNRALVAGCLGSGILTLCLVYWLRYGLFEAGVFPTSCGMALADGLEGLCLGKWALMQTFAQERLGWVSLVAGAAAFALRSVPLAGLGWVSGIAGLVLYSYDFAAVGVLLSLLVFVRRAART